MAEPLSIAAAIVALGTFATQVAQSLRCIVHRLKTVPEELAVSNNDLQSLRLVLNQLDTISKNRASLQVHASQPDIYDALLVELLASCKSTMI